MGDSSVFDYTRLKACQLTDLAPTLNPSDRRKRVECPSAAVEFSFADFSCRVVMSSFFHVCTSFYTTSRRNQNLTNSTANNDGVETNTKQSDVFIRNKEGVSSPPSCGLYVEIRVAFTHPYSLCSPTLTLGCQCGFTGSTEPVTTTRNKMTSL